MTTRASLPDKSAVADCPTAAILERFVELELAGEERLTVAEHVAACEACRKRIQNTPVSGLEAPGRAATVSHQMASTIERIVENLCQEVASDGGNPAIADRPIRLPPGPTSEWIGALNERYLIRRELASGATATVFEAFDSHSSRPVAIKFIRSSGAAVLRRIEREVRAIQTVRHPNLVPVEAVETTEDGRVFLVQPLIAGRSLSDLIHHQKFDTTEQAVDIIAQIAAGLTAVHGAGMVHRDVKPANILVDHQQVARLTDFGLALFVDEESSLTEVGAVVGTPAYMSPEQASEGQTVDQRSDVWSLGATLYECLTETRPFRGQLHQILRQIRELEPVRPATINPSVPRPLEAICLKAMSRNPAARYPNADALLDDLRRWQQGKPVRARLPGPWHRFKRWLARDPRFSLALLGLAASLLAGLLTAGWFRSQAARQTGLADRRFENSLQSIHVLADLASQTLNGDPGLVSIRSQIHQMADKAFAPLLDHPPENRTQLAPYLDTLVRLKKIKQSVATPEGALAFCSDQISRNRTAAEANLDDDEVRRAWARLARELAVSHVELRSFAEAETALNDAEALLENSNPDDGLLLASVRHSRGNAKFHATGDAAGAILLFREAVAIVEDYLALHPDDRLAAETRNNSLNWVASCELQLGNAAAAEARMREAWDYYAELADGAEGTYLNRLEKQRTATSLLNLMTRTGDLAAAREWATAVQPEITALALANPALMEPACVRIGFGCDAVSVELLSGNYKLAESQCRQLREDAEQLSVRFPDTTRVWMAQGHARQTWGGCLLHSAEYEAAAAFLREWIAELDAELEQQKQVPRNTQLKWLLQVNLAFVLDWQQAADEAEIVWNQVEQGSPPTMRQGMTLFRQIELVRSQLRSEQPVALQENLSLAEGLNQAKSLFAGGVMLPSVHHKLAELNAVTAALLAAGPGSEGDSAQGALLEECRNAAREHLRLARAGGFFAVGNREQFLKDDPLFASIPE